MGAEPARASPNDAPSPPALPAHPGLVAAAVAALVASVALSAPLREQGGDTVPGRLGMAVLACDGGWHLDGVDWLARSAGTGHTPYFVTPTPDGRHLVSTFGPGPALLGWPAALGLASGELVTDRLLSRRARWASALAVALSAGLLALGLLIATGRSRGALGGLVAGLAFAGAATLGQGLWQQTASLLPLMTAFGLLLAGQRRPELSLLTPGLAALAAFARPADAPLALALAAGAFWTLRAASRSGRLWALSGLFALGLLVRPLLWDLRELGQLLPLGQLAVNRVSGGGSAFDLSATHLGVGLAGLVVSPSRGLLFFAPVALVGVGLALRERAVVPRLLAAGVLLQLLVIAAFHKWWGGLCFGPRLLAAAVWVGVGLAFWLEPRRGRLRALVAGCAALTVLVGVVGAIRYDPRSFELRREVDAHPERLFDMADSALLALFAPAPEGRLVAVPEGPFRFCGPRPLTDVPSAP